MTNFSELRNHHLEFSGEKKQNDNVWEKEARQDWMSSALLFTGRKSCPHRWNLTCSLFPLYGLLSVWQPDPCLLSLKKSGQIIDGHERLLFLSLNLFFSVRVCVRDANPDVPSLPAGISTFSMRVSQVEKTCQSNKACTHTSVSCRICFLQNVRPRLIYSNHILYF